jgi:hypothetical protein
MKRYVLFLSALVVLTACRLEAPTPQIAALDFGSLEPVATGQTYYVSGIGDDNNTGLSTDQAFRTLQKAADLTQHGDTVQVMNGLYTSAEGTHVLSVNTSGTPDNWIIYQAYPGHKPFIKLNQDLRKQAEMT